MSDFTFLQRMIIYFLNWSYSIIRKAIILFTNNEDGFLTYLDLKLFRIYTRVLTLLVPWKRLSSQTKKNESTCEKGCQLIDINLLCKDRQSVHPDIIELNLFNYHGWAMVISSYPYRCDYYENPIIAQSLDAISWKPVDAELGYRIKNNSTHQYHSDPSLLHLAGSVAFFDRVVQVNKNGTANICIFLQLSKDLNHWSEPQKIMHQYGSFQNHAKLLSPTFLEFGNKFLCWYAEKDEYTENLRMFRMESDDLYTWKNKSEVVVEGLAEGGIWHLDIIEYNGKLLMAGDIKYGKTHRIQLFISDDYGFTWVAHNVIIESGIGFSRKSVYRASIIIKDEKLYLYYTGRSILDRWQTAMKIFPLEVIL